MLCSFYNYRWIVLSVSLRGTGFGRDLVSPEFISPSCCASSGLSLLLVLASPEEYDAAPEQEPGSCLLTATSCC